MKKKILCLAFLLCLIAPKASFGFDTTNKVAFLEDVMKDVVKQTLYGIGTSMLNKYMNPANYNYTPPPDNSIPNDSSASSTTTTTVQQNNGYVPGQDSPPEEMIPVS